MRRLAVSSFAILLGGGLAGGVYWAFLSTPESTIGTLVLSALLAVTSLALVGLTVNAAMAAWSDAVGRESWRRSLSAVPTILPALIIVVFAWWLVGRATDWVTMQSGPINAWFIARFGWADASALFTAVDWIGRWLRWVVAPLVALSLVASMRAAGWASALRGSWIRSGLSPVRLGLATVWFALLVAAPWIYLAPWRPRGLPPTGIEAAFVVSKLSLTAVLMAIGAALVIREAARMPLPRHDPPIL